MSTVSAPPPATRSISSRLVEVHVDRADVAQQPQPAAVAEHVERLGVAGAEERQRVAAVAAVDVVAAVARPPAEPIEVAAERRGVVAGAAAHVVEAVAADQRVVARAAAQHVVAVAADERQRHRGDRGADDVVAVAPVDGQPVRCLGVREAHERRAEHAERADRDLVVVVRAEHRGAVVARAEVGVDLEDLRLLADGHAVGAGECADAHDVDA